MPRLSKKAKAEWSFFINSLTGKRQFNLLCQHCVRECKQSYRAQILDCPSYRDRVQTGVKTPHNPPMAVKWDNTLPAF